MTSPASMKVEVAEIRCSADGTLLLLKHITVLLCLWHRQEQRGVVTEVVLFVEQHLD